MHYDQFAFAKDRKIPTIYSKSGSTLGNTVGFTQVKMHKVNQIYESRGYCGSFFTVELIKLSERCLKIEHNVSMQSWRR